MSNVPKLRFNGFRDELRKDKFKNLVELQRGSSPRPIIKYITNSPDGVNWIKIGDVSKDATVIENTKEKITKEGAKKSRYVEVGDLILSNSMSFGRPYIMAIDGCIHDGWFVLKKYTQNFNRDYLCQLLISPAIQKQYKKLAAGGVVENISSELVNSVIVNLPSLKEQEKIANFLNKIDKLIEKQNEKVSNLEKYKKGMMQKIFSQQIRFKDDEGIDYPNWEEKEFSEFLTSRVQKQLPSQEAPLMAFTSTGGIEPKGDKYDRSFLVKSDEKLYKLTELNDFIYSSNNLDVGSIGLNEYGKAVISDVYEIFIISQEVSHKFISELIKIPKVINKMIRYRQGVMYGQYRIHAEDFLKIREFIPCLEEQNKISNFLSKIDLILGKEKEKLEELKVLKNGLLQGLFV